MAQLRDGWVNELDTNEHGRRFLTLHKAMLMAADGGKAGWYIAPFAMKWAIGRMTADEERHHVLLENGEPITFQHAREAKAFLSGLLEAGVHIDVPPHAAKPVRTKMFALSKGIGRGLWKNWRLGV